MQRFEYRIADQRDLTDTGMKQLLAQYGDQGWELVCAYGNGNNLIFKRPNALLPISGHGALGAS